ncbi:MAG: lysophospholipid acyltransferase family protein [Myxococcota bacterium]|nr:lysophospholipid acyltransferase family protein [Myxococcota bacterium]
MMRARLVKAGLSDVRLSHVWADLGRRLFEVLAMERFLALVDFHDQAIERFHRAHSEGHSVVVATSHLGNWELMAAALVRAGFIVKSIAAHPSPGPVHHALEQHRKKFGICVFQRGQGGAREAVNHLKKGGYVGLFCDQCTSERSTPQIFMGRPAPTPTTLNRLTQLTDSRILLLWNLRRPDGRYRIYAENITAENVGDPGAWIQRRLSELVEAHPEQWVWLHDRWADEPRKARVEPVTELS